MTISTRPAEIRPASRGAADDAGYDLTRLAWLLADLPADVTGRLRSDRVMYFPAPPRPARPASAGGRRAQAGLRRSGELAGPGRHHRHGHRPVRRKPSPAAGAPRQLGGPRRRAPGSRGHSHPAAGGPPARMPRCGPRLAMVRPRRGHRRRREPVLAGVPAPLRYRTYVPVPRADPGLDPPELRDPAAADRWTWLVIAAYAQLHLARDLAADVRLPWQRPCPPGRLTPARVRRGFRRIRQDLPVPASAPKPSRPGPGRPNGSKNRRPVMRHDVGKILKREEPKEKTRRQAG